ncbi:hypothetical protein BGZ47_006087 [Haplosporangium gracile]|nr:hypothetical protein BGZ47_006087 [Haplosporangium gracile]
MKSRWNLIAPTPPGAPVAVNGRPISAKRLADYEAEMEIVRITTRQQNTLPAAIYLDPNLLDDNLWKSSISCGAERVFSKARYLTSNRKFGLRTSHLRYILFSSSMTKALTALQKERQEAKNIDIFESFYVGPFVGISHSRQRS